MRSVSAGFLTDTAELRVQGKVDCDKDSIKSEHSKGNTVVKVLDNPAYKNMEVFQQLVE